MNSVKVQQINAPLNIYVVTTDVIISPYNIEYTLEWYNKLSGEEHTLDEIKLLQLFTQTELGYKPIYQPDDKQVLYWEYSTPAEKQQLGDNYMLQPTPSPLGTIMNYYGDIYTKKSFYDAIELYKDIKEPEILCTSEF